MTDEHAQKQDILRELLVSEKDTLNELKELVLLSKPLFKIEQETGNIIFSNSATSASNKDKIQLLLTGKYFAKMIGVTQQENITLADISQELGVVRTTLSGPLGELVNEGTVRKDGAGTYLIVYHRIKTILQKYSHKEGKK